LITGRTLLIAHLGFPTESFEAPMIYNPWFERQGIDAVVVPLGVEADDYPATLKAPATLTTRRGALVTMPTQGHDAGPGRRGDADRAHRRCLQRLAEAPRRQLAR
jgi:hypothetical protein